MRIFGMDADDLQLVLRQSQRAARGRKNRSAFHVKQMICVKARLKHKAFSLGKIVSTKGEATNRSRTTSHTAVSRETSIRRTGAYRGKLARHTLPDNSVSGYRRPPDWVPAGYWKHTDVCAGRQRLRRHDEATSGQDRAAPRPAPKACMDDRYHQHFQTFLRILGELLIRWGS
jgi:hypothetical protein